MIFLERDERAYGQEAALASGAQAKQKHSKKVVTAIQGTAKKRGPPQNPTAALTLCRLFLKGFALHRHIAKS